MPFETLTPDPPMIMLPLRGSVDPAGEARFAGGIRALMDAFLTPTVRKASITTSPGKPASSRLSQYREM
ncbi:hypothetical protein [Actinophytocola sp.]|uniref:hypothetical protein n=1 Tax=Actinophytocola sp. TaxID=1872138 RepID=UPI002ECFF402